MGSSVVFMLYCTGIARVSHLMPMTFATNWPGIGDGTRPVMSNVSSAPPACVAATPAITIRKHREVTVFEDRVWVVIDVLLSYCCR